MSKYLIFFLLLNINQIYAFISTDPENNTLDNDILSDLPEEEKNPLVAVYSNLIYTLKYPEDVEINGYIKFSKNDLESQIKKVESKNSNTIQDKIMETEKPTEYSIDINTTEYVDLIQNFTERPVYTLTKNEIEFNTLTWEERWNNVYEHLKNFLKEHDVELRVPYYDDKVVKLSLRNWIENGTMIELKLYPDGKINAADEEKLPKEELQSLTRLKSMISGVFFFVRDIVEFVTTYVLSIGVKLLIVPGIFILTVFPIIAIVNLYSYFF